MGNRLTKIYTRTGDDGTTGLADGNRISKASSRIALIGDVDELNSHIGFLRTKCSGDIDTILEGVQNLLFDLGAELALPEKTLFPESSIPELEKQLDYLNEELEPLKEFILPGGSEAASRAHVARSVCRRAERSAVLLMNEEAINTSIVNYLNRLSDYLFVLARHLNKIDNTTELTWTSPNSRVS